MIGQEKILEQLDIEYGIKELPRFIIITGARGQGKKTLSGIIANRFNLELVNVGTKIEDIRYMITTATKQINPTMYLIADADDMSLGAKNSLLKVIEEPPQNAYFVMTLQQIENTLETIKSRCYEIKMLPYSDFEKSEMIKKLTGDEGDIAYPNDVQILSKLDNYWQMQKVLEYGAVDFYMFVRQVYDNIYRVQAANSFKIAERLDLKNDEKGYDLDLFFIMYQYCCIEDLLDDNSALKDKYDIIDRCLRITSKFRQLLQVKGVNKQMLIDMWVLAIRKEWLLSLG